jgi:hypothetical protein
MKNKRLLVGIGAILTFTLFVPVGFSQGQPVQNRIPQQIIINGQSANGAYVTAPGGGLQSFTCSAPQQYSTVDGATQGWACFDQATGAWLLKALPPAQPQAQASTVPPAAPVPPAPLPQQPAVIYQPAPAVVYGPPVYPVFVGPAYPSSVIYGTAAINAFGRIAAAAIYPRPFYRPIRFHGRF